MRRIFAIVLIVLGLGTIGAAIASGTIWRPDDRVTLTLPATPDVPLVLTAPGVLSAVDDDVDVRIVGADADSPIVLAMARESDVRAWVGDAAHWEITGIVDWETLEYVDSRDGGGSEPATPTDEATETPTDGATETPTDEATETPTDEATETPTDDAPETETVPNPSGSDLWVEELTATGELEYSWTAVPGRWVMLVATDGTEPAPQVELTWDRVVETPFVRPGVILGSVVLLLGLGLLILQILADLEKRRARRAAAAAASETTSAAAVVSATDGDRPLTRREIRLAEEARRRGDKPGSKPIEGNGETETVRAVIPENESAPSAATPAEGGEPADDAGELDAWVRSGAASPLLHEGERTTPTDLDVPEHEASEEPGEVTPSDDEKSARERWWRRRSTRKADEAPAAGSDDSTPVEPDAVENEAAEERTTEKPAAGGSAPATGDTDEIPAVDAEEEDPQEWGASWRQTWGLGSDDAAETESKEGER